MIPPHIAVMRQFFPDESKPSYEELEDMLRLELWDNHGHPMRYGDDGELQCSQCGVDYKRAPLNELLAAAHLARHTVAMMPASLTTRQMVDRLKYFTRIMERTVEVFGDRDLARSWLNARKNCFDGRTALEMLDCEANADKVDKLLDGIPPYQPMKG